MSKRCAVALCKCQKTNKNFEIRMERKTKIIDNQNITVLETTWAYKIKSEATPQSSGSSKQDLKGLFFFADTYPGCPYCGNKNICLCGTCNQLFCMDEKQSVVVCPWDNKKLQLRGVIEGITGEADR